jgi:hypothetical protein
MEEELEEKKEETLEEDEDQFERDDDEDDANAEDIDDEDGPKKSKVQLKVNINVTNLHEKQVEKQNEFKELKTPCNNSELLDLIFSFIAADSKSEESEGLINKHKLN